MKRAILLLLFCGVILTSLSGQFRILTAYDGLLIGPKNVNIVFQEQVEYYSTNYALILEDLERQKKYLQKRYKKYSRKSKKYRARLKMEKTQRALATIKNEIEAVKAFIVLWQQEPFFRGWKEFESAYDPAKCFDVFTNSKILSKHEYHIVSSQKKELVWEEIIDAHEVAIKKIDVTPDKNDTRWVKEKPTATCTSDFPNECLVWKIKETLGKPYTYYYFDHMPSGFVLVQEAEVFVRRVSTKNYRNEKLKIIDKNNTQIIEIIDFREVACD
ncbi:MAG: hypothetical protein AAF573_03815 [Bacteroidota bacterium]